MSVVTGLLYLLLRLFWMLLLARLVLGYVQMFAREWRPRGILLVLAEGVYTITDPPLKALRRVLPPIRIGQMSFDTAYLVLFVLVVVAMDFVA